MVKGNPGLVAPTRPGTRRWQRQCLCGCWVHSSCSLPTHQMSYYVPGTLKPHLLLSASSTVYWCQVCASPLETQRRQCQPAEGEGDSEPQASELGLQLSQELDLRGKNHSCWRAQQGKDGAGTSWGLCSCQYTQMLGRIAGALRCRKE